MTDPIQIRAYREGDEIGILDCYNRVFPNPEAGIPARSLAHWNWKFRDNPCGVIQHAVAEHEELGIVGVYAGIPYRIWSEGRDQLAAQGCDLCVLPEWRRHGKRPGLFIHIGWKFHELYCGKTDGKVLFTFGWPVPAWRMGQKYLGYWNIRDWDFTFLELDGKPRDVPAELETKEVERYGDDVDALWEDVKPSIGLALTRDKTYFNWRYADCPDQDYRLYECRERATGKLRGVCVYCVGNLVRPNTGFIVDWLDHAGDDAVMTSMLGAMEAQARADRTGVIAGVWNHIDPRFLAFQRKGYMLMGTDYFLVLASFKYDTFYYRNNWFFTMGDSDLI